MNNYLEHHTMRIKALSPIHIGSGEKLIKKEYIYMPSSRTIIVPDLGMMYEDICKRPIKRQFEQFLLGDSDDLRLWLESNGFKTDSYQKWKRYSLEVSDIVGNNNRGNSRKLRNIMTFVKDGRGVPYVPGSSIKGMMRTALLCWEIRHNKHSFTRELHDFVQQINKKTDMDNYLAVETDAIEMRAFHTLKRAEAEIGNAVNSNMAGLIIGDSRPIHLEQLILSEKIEYNLNHMERRLPIFRETLKPGTDIEFELTIDKEVCPYTISMILEALDEFQQISYDRFYSLFGRGSNQSGTVWLGGGCGFLSKTIIYAAFDNEALTIADTIFKNVLGIKQYKNHKHFRDKDHGIAPHICKCTRYHGKLYDMGMGKIELVS